VADHFLEIVLRHFGVAGAHMLGCVRFHGAAYWTRSLVAE
jgi:hypothetical protein